MEAKNKDTSAASLSKDQLQYRESKYDKLMRKRSTNIHYLKIKKGNVGFQKSKTQNMLQRFIHCKEQILDFAKDFRTPFCNNLADQAIRMMKVKQKISGCFTSTQGAKDFADIRSYIASAQKQGIVIRYPVEVAIK